MSDKQEKGNVLKESFKGASNLNIAQAELKKSFTGAANLRPTPVPTQKPPSQPASPPPQKIDTGKKK